jgi:phage baseplate assembly protein W
MRRDYGSRLFELVDAPTNRQTIIDIIAATAEALIKWEPRITVEKVRVSALDAGKVTLELFGIYTPTGERIALDGLVV